MAWNGCATMTATPMSSPRARRHARWLLPAALLALAPKCLLCVVGWAGLGAALGLGPELCGGSTGLNLHGWAWLAVAATGAVVAGWFVWSFKRTRLAPIAHSSAAQKPLR